MLSVSSLTTRSSAMDVLRGLAVLGILIANLTAFSSPALKVFESSGLASSAAEAWAFVWREVFLSGKARGMLAMLFGAGVWIVYEKAVEKGLAWPKAYMPRMAWLAVIGLIHALFIWFGDILFVYALTGVVAAALVKLSTKALLWTAGVLLGLGALVGLGIGALTVFSDGPSTSEQIAMIPVLGTFLSVEGETAIYSSPNWLMHTLHRGVFFLFNAFNLIFVIPGILAPFLVGIVLARTGVLRDPASRPDVLKKMMLVGFGIGLPLNLLPLFAGLRDLSGLFTYFIEMGAASVMSIGYLAVAAWLAVRLPRIMSPFERVGRISLTVYLMQSVLATFAFYGYGLGFYGRLDYFGQLGVAGVIWAIVILFAWFWTKRFDIGPVEWAWRSVLAKQKLPWKRQPSRDAAASIVNQ
ncbi:MAG: DUF418 domain-containing protein [Fimbriimonadaceae bacterium]|nr:DUF418 domain-containing protein [Fimbriimonadaceae bacterium]